MKNYVVTCCDERHWRRWGWNWLTTLRRFYDGEVVVIGYDLPKEFVDGKERNVRVVNRPPTKTMRQDALRLIVGMAAAGVWAYWDIDVAFQADISEAFNFDGEFLACTTSPGFFAGSALAWKRYGEICDLIALADESADESAVKKHFGKLLKTVDETWNFTDVTKLRVSDGKLFFNGKLQKVIHPTGEIKSQMTHGDITLVLSELLGRYMLAS